MIVREIIQQITVKEQGDGPARVALLQSEVVVAQAFGVVNIVRNIGLDKNYEHTQSVSSTTWVIVHNLGKRPAVSVVDSEGRECYGDVVYNSANQCTVNFSAAFGGKAYCN